MFSERDAFLLFALIINTIGLRAFSVVYSDTALKHHFENFAFISVCLRMEFSEYGLGLYLSIFNLHVFKTSPIKTDRSLGSGLIAEVGL